MKNGQAAYNIQNLFPRFRTCVGGKNRENILAHNQPAARHLRFFL